MKSTGAFVKLLYVASALVYYIFGFRVTRGGRRGHWGPSAARGAHVMLRVKLRCLPSPRARFKEAATERESGTKRNRERNQRFTHFGAVDPSPPNIKSATSNQPHRPCGCVCVIGPAGVCACACACVCVGGLIVG